MAYVPLVTANAWSFTLQFETSRSARVNDIDSLATQFFSKNRRTLVRNQHLRIGAGNNREMPIRISSPPASCELFFLIHSLFRSAAARRTADGDGGASASAAPRVNCGVCDEYIAPDHRRAHGPSRKWLRHRCVRRLFLRRRHIVLPFALRQMD